ncbi:phosphopantetheine-binding protein [Microcoleus asticus]|uniref:Polyketide biosynthesis acyl-carrier-protein AcpK n=1 Tax=Microcoleus asticus IPMA8 TaxID=2563858 RepID=A0ABX2CXS7_9CYAN|nr:phosphopantetheine-binding protein [Microcoleus asticus]NQE34728.1 Polyketide biosynthesis acyl-carrier-protein AcpK [Microcoleus asticus IPMA8]
MNREEVLNTVIKNMKLNVDGLEETEIDPKKSMAEYGTNSLDIVEIVNSSLRELKIKVPRTQLAGLMNINDLVDMLTKVKNEQV